MSYPGNYAPASAYPPVTAHPPAGYPPAQQYPQQPPPPQPYAPQPQQPQAYAPPPQQYPPPQAGYAPAQYAAPQYAAQYAPPAYPTAYPAATAWAPAASYGYAPAAVAYPAAYAAPAVAYPPVMSYPAPYSPYPAAVAVPVAPAMNYVFQFAGVHLDRKDIFSKSDPFLAIFASRHPGGYHQGHNIARRDRKESKHNKKFGGISGNWVLIHRTETLKNNQNPLWAPFTVNLISLCGGNFDTVFKVEVWDSDIHSNHDFIGGAVTTMRELQTSKELRLINKRRIGIYNSSGRLEVVRCAPA